MRTLTFILLAMAACAQPIDKRDAGHPADIGHPAEAAPVLHLAGIGGGGVTPGPTPVGGAILANVFDTDAGARIVGSGRLDVVEICYPADVGPQVCQTAAGGTDPTALHCTGDAGTCILTPGIEVPRLDDWGGFNIWGGGLSLYSDHTGANYDAIWVTPQLSPSVREYVGTLDGGTAREVIADNPNADAVEELACGNENNVVSRVDCRGTMSIAGQLCFGFGNDAGCQSAPSTGPGLSKTIGGTCSGVFVNGVATSCTCTGAVDAGTNCH